MKENFKECVIVKVLSSKPKSKKYSHGSLKFVPLEILRKNKKVANGEKITVKINQRTTLECEVLDSEIEIVDPHTAILDDLEVCKVSENYDYYDYATNHETSYKYTKNPELNEYEEQDLKLLHNCEIANQNQNQNIAILKKESLELLES
ncbi:unnamed protein product, partial [Brachionus calyciflorus]